MKVQIADHRIGCRSYRLPLSAFRVVQASEGRYKMVEVLTLTSF